MNTDVRVHGHIFNILSMLRELHFSCIQLLGSDPSVESREIMPMPAHCSSYAIPLGSLDGLCEAEAHVRRAMLQLRSMSTVPKAPFSLHQNLQFPAPVPSPPAAQMLGALIATGMCQKSASSESALRGQSDHSNCLSRKANKSPEKSCFTARLHYQKNISGEESNGASGEHLRIVTKKRKIGWATTAGDIRAG